MTNNYCAVDGCGNKRKVKKTFFTLPVNEERRKIWLDIIGRPDLLNRTDLKPTSHYVCLDHFDESMTIKRLLLKPDAVPSKLVPKPSDTTNSQQPTRSSDQTTQTEDPLDRGNVISVTRRGNYCRTSETQTDIELNETQTAALLEGTQRKRKYSELKESETQIRKLRQDLNKIKKELECKRTLSLAALDADDEDHEAVARLNKLVAWRMKLKSHSKGNRYEPEYKLFALNLHFLSPPTYRNLKTFLKLPSESTLHKFKLQVPPKLDDGVFECIEKIIKSLPEQAKYCTLCIGEMALKRNLYYDIKKDELVGIHNINGNVENRIASNACVIMVRGIGIDWVQPVAYALLENSKHYQQMETWIEETIKRLSDIGIEIMAVVSDQGSNFDKYAKEVKGVTAEKPYFTFKDKKIYYILDVPHLIKCIRNNLLTNDFHYDGEQVSWKYIKLAYDQRKDKNLRLMYKITEDHIAPNNFQKMRVEYATQIFSFSVFAALDTLIYTKDLPEEARATAEFVEKINNFIDVLNSNAVKSTNKYQTAFSLKEHQMEILKEVQNLFEKITTVSLKTGNDSTNRITTFKNIQITIQSVIMLFKDLKDKGFTFLFTRRLNQDPLVNFFDNIRQQGNCRDPTPIQFTRAFSKRFLSNMLKNSKAGNCQDLSELLDRGRSPDEGNLRNLLVASARAAPTQLTLNSESDHRFDLPTENALTYVAGYLLFKCKEAHQCPDFTESQKEVPLLNETRMYTHYKAFNKKSKFYGCLKMPMESFTTYVKTLEAVFLEYFVKMSLTSPGNSLCQILKTIPFQAPCLCFPRHYLLKLFIRIRIFTLLKFNNKLFRSNKNVRHHLFKLNYIM